MKNKPWTSTLRKFFRITRLFPNPRFRARATMRFDTVIQNGTVVTATDTSVADVGIEQLEEMGHLVSEGVTSFKLFMAYRGVFMLDDATIFKAMRQAAKHSGLICMHAENGGAIDVIVQQALAEGKRAPKYHALTRDTSGRVSLRRGLAGRSRRWRRPFPRA